MSVNEIVERVVAILGIDRLKARLDQLESWQKDTIPTIIQQNQDITGIIAVIQQQQTQLLANIDEITKTNNIAATAYDQAKQSLSNSTAAYDQAKQSLSNSTAAFDNAKVAYDKAISEGKEAWNLARDSIIQLGNNLNVMKARFTTMANNLSSGVTNTAKGISSVTKEIGEIQTSLNRKILGVPDYAGAFGNTMDCMRNIGSTFTSLKSTLTNLRDDSNNLKNSLSTISQPAAK